MLVVHFLVHLFHADFFPIYSRNINKACYFSEFQIASKQINNKYIPLTFQFHFSSVDFDVPDLCFVFQLVLMKLPILFPIVLSFLCIHLILVGCR